MSTVRTRFAPSPTGYMHVGNLRTALYTYLQARHNGGTFILRIEDTDQGRLVEGATDIIYGTLKATGLTWDEGPDVGGPVGPYVQSQRMGMFKQYAEQLVKAGKAYYCFCTEERLNEMHEAQRAAGEMTHYDGHCRHLSAEEVAAKRDCQDGIHLKVQANVVGICRINTAGCHQSCDSCKNTADHIGQEFDHCGI